MELIDLRQSENRVQNNEALILQERRAAAKVTKLLLVGGLMAVFAVVGCSMEIRNQKGIVEQAVQIQILTFW